MRVLVPPLYGSLICRYLYVEKPLQCLHRCLFVSDGGFVFSLGCGLSAPDIHGVFSMELVCSIILVE